MSEVPESFTSQNVASCFALTAVQLTRHAFVWLANLDTKELIGPHRIACEPKLIKHEWQIKLVRRVASSSVRPRPAWLSLFVLGVIPDANGIWNSRRFVVSNHMPTQQAKEFCQTHSDLRAQGGEGLEAFYKNLPLTAS